jgi:hypothetical protein
VFGNRDFHTLLGYFVHQSEAVGLELTRWNLGSKFANKPKMPAAIC